MVSCSLHFSRSSRTICKEAILLLLSFLETDTGKDASQVSIAATGPSQTAKERRNGICACLNGDQQIVHQLGHWVAYSISSSIVFSIGVISSAIGSGVVFGIGVISSIGVIRSIIGIGVVFSIIGSGVVSSSIASISGRAVCSRTYDE